MKMGLSCQRKNLIVFGGKLSLQYRFLRRQIENWVTSEETYYINTLNSNLFD